MIQDDRVKNALRKDLNMHSTDEIVVGTWTKSDGTKVTLYEKTIYFNISTTTTAFTYVSHNIANVDLIHIVDFQYQHSNSWYKCPNDAVVEIGVSNTDFSYYNNNSYVVNNNAFVVLEYTKTTD